MRADLSRLKFIWDQGQSAGMSRREFLQLLGTSGIATIVAACSPTATLTRTVTPISPPALPTVTMLSSPTPPPPFTPTPQSLDTPKPFSYEQLPQWRGFNLLEKFNNDVPSHNRPYYEQDLDFMVGWGFDFIRLPTDYRIWTISSGAYREQPLKEIDQVIGWARMRGIHVNLCLHRAPGYCVNLPKEPLNLWADGPNGAEARRQFAEQWRMLARRYRDIPAAELSFNLVNEPPDILGVQYAQAVAPAIEAIQEESPGRLIIADGANYGRRPVSELVPLKIAQSTRGYEPFLISHYRASWVDGSDNWPVPTWPISVIINQFLYGNDKPDFKSPLILRGNFPQNAQFSIKVHQVSNNAELVIKANGTVILEKFFQPGAGKGEWKESVFQEEWQIYLGIYDKEYSVPLPNDTQEIAIEVERGDWLTFSDIIIKPFPGVPTNELVIKSGDFQWGIHQEPIIVNQQGHLSSASGNAGYSKETLWVDYVERWKRFSTQQGIGVHVGEWGAHNQTPHEVVLAWMKDCLDNWKQAGIGWALWNLRGSFGVLDSDRADVVYENYRGHKLDRKMLELLKNVG